MELEENETTFDKLVEEEKKLSKMLNKMQLEDEMKYEDEM